MCKVVYKKAGQWFVAQLVEWSLLIPEVRGSNPVIGKILFILNICLPSTVYRKDENKEEEAENGPLKKVVYIKYSDWIQYKLEHDTLYLRPTGELGTL